MISNTPIVMDARLSRDGEAWTGRLLRFLFVLAVHVLLAVAILTIPLQPVPEPEPIRFAVRVIELPAPPPVVRAPEPTPPAPLPVTPELRRPAPRPAAVPAPRDRPRVAAVAPAPPSPATEPVPAAPAPAPVTAVRYDAAYLNNPAPLYPSQSRRRGEQGRVLLRVQVDARGLPERVEIEQSSGHARLDQAALEAVRRWRFVPARRGDATVAASVLVPIEFQMQGR